MTLKKAIVTTLEDWLKRDPEMPRHHWVIGSLLVIPLLPIVVAVRTQFTDPERNPDFGKKPTP